MAHKRSDTYMGTGEWAKHLRPKGKKRQASAERREARRKIRQEQVSDLRK